MNNSSSKLVCSVLTVLINSLMPTLIKPFIKAPSELQLNKFILLLFLLIQLTFPSHL